MKPAVVRTGATEEVPAPRLPASRPGLLVYQAAPGGRTLTEDVEKLRDTLDKLGARIVEAGLQEQNAVARRSTLEAVEALGPLAVRYIPQIIRSTEDRDLFVRWIAARSLGRLAPHGADKAVPALTAMLDDPDMDARMAAAHALGLFGPDAKSAVPALTERLLKGDAEVRIANMKALEGIGTDSVSALPTIAKLFTFLDSRVRSEAARLTGRFGSSPKTREEARKYLPDLRRLTLDLDTDVRKAAAGAILEIQAGE
jgi:HEAT repeat protein